VTNEIVLFLAGVVVLYFGAEWLVGGSARRMVLERIGFVGFYHG
jgi:hypothetical protein